MLLGVPQFLLFAGVSYICANVKSLLVYSSVLIKFVVAWVDFS